MTQYAVRGACLGRSSTPTATASDAPHSTAAALLTLCAVCRPQRRHTRRLCARAAASGCLRCAPAAAAAAAAAIGRVSRTARVVTMLCCTIASAVTVMAYPAHPPQDPPSTHRGWTCSALPTLGSSCSGRVPYAVCLRVLLYATTPRPRVSCGGIEIEPSGLSGAAT